jgi:MoaA/NifB/PqqE/SkfB family radical SAM enzyme
MMEKIAKRVIVWRTIQDCTMSCGFCSYSSEVSRKRDTANVSDVERFIKILGRYIKETKREILVSWIGGEPFLWNQLIPFSKSLHDEFEIRVSTTTNGLSLSAPEIRADVIKYFSEIVFSLDGLPAFNDRVRNFPGHFDTVAENIAALKLEMKRTNSALAIKVNTILMRGNIEHFEPFCERLREFGVSELTFNQLGGFDRPDFYPENRLRAEQVKDFIAAFPRVQKRFKESGLVIHGSGEYLRRILLSSENEKMPVYECNPGNWFFFINEKGYISPCSYTSHEYRVHINDIVSARDIDTVEEMFKKYRLTARSRWCDDCHCTQVNDKFA